MAELVSIIIPVYNAKEYLTECLESILDQTYINLEVILVDDGSTDGSADICDEYAGKDNRIRVYHKENGGVSSARNFGIQKSKGEYIAFCDSDDLMKPNLIEFFVESTKLQNADFLCCGYERLIDNKRTVFESDVKEAHFTQKDKAVEYVFCDRQCLGFLWNKFFKSRIIKHEPEILFDERIAILEDEMFVLEYIQRCSSFFLSNVPLYIYRRNMGGALRSPFSEKNLTTVIAREWIYEHTKKFSTTEALKRIAFEKLLSTYISYYKKLFFSKLQIRHVWMKHILVGFKKICKDYKPENLSYKKKLGYWCLWIVGWCKFFLHNAKG